ncbi:MAG: hypothetical protein U0840_23375 [Gemmataceae bacterium]
MSAHRIQAYFEASSTSANRVAVQSAGFIPCPSALLMGVSLGQFQVMVEIYRLARERVNALQQPRAPRKLYLAEFSVN